jgi:hypothetical protein
VLVAAGAAAAVQQLQLVLGFLAVMETMVV